MVAKILSSAKLLVRNAQISDIPDIYNLAEKVYSNMPPYTFDVLRGPINNFPEGQFVAIYEDKIVGYCATFMVSEDKAISSHNWHSITGHGFATTHDPDGDFLYGMEVCIDPDVRGMRIGQRLYDERKKLCKEFRLKGIVIVGRMPGFSRRVKKLSNPQEYVEMVKNKKIRDQVLTFQMRNGFDVLGVIKNYLPEDKESAGYGVHMVWRNPEINQDEEINKVPGMIRGRVSNTVRIGTVQYKQRRVSSFDEFKKHVEYFVDTVADYRGDFIVFPELFTLQLLSLEDQKLTPEQSIESLTRYTEPFKQFMNKLAIEYNINIIGGSHPTMVDGEVMNICYVFLRDGSIHEQIKIHPTPSERYWWNIKGGDKLSTIETDCGPIGVLICYDSEFPELSRHLVNQGAKILFVPFCTDERQGYLRVRYCSQARAVENQCYVVLSGNVGNLPGVENMDIQYAQSCILTPCDFPFARDGVAADTTPNAEMVAFADLRLDLLVEARNSGTVKNLKDRRSDLYSISWKGV